MMIIAINLFDWRRGPAGELSITQSASLRVINSFTILTQLKNDIRNFESTFQLSTQCLRRGQVITIEV